MKPSNEFCIKFLEASGWLDNHDKQIRAEVENELLETEKYDELSQKIAIDILERGILKGRTDAERDFQNSDYWNDYLAKVIKDAKADAIEECIDKFAEIMSNMPQICGRSCPVDCNWGTTTNCKVECKKWLRKQLKEQIE